VWVHQLPGNVFRVIIEVLLKMMWLLKLPLDQNLIVIYHKSNSDFKSHIIFIGTRGGLLACFCGTIIKFCLFVALNIVFARW
jgi:hypothetical protein